MAEKINPQHHGALVSMFEKIEIEGYVHSNEGFKIIGAALKSTTSDPSDLDKFKKILTYFQENGMKDPRNGSDKEEAAGKLIAFLRKGLKNPTAVMVPANTIKLGFKTSGGPRKSIPANKRGYYDSFLKDVGIDVIALIEEGRRKEIVIDTGFSDEDMPIAPSEIGCKKCVSGYVRAEDGRMNFCECYLKEQLRVKIVKSGIPKEYTHINNLNSADVVALKKMYGAPRATSKSVNINSLLKNYGTNIDKIREEGWNIVFEGPTGSGKTSAACICGKIALRRGYSLMFVEVQKLRKLWTGEKLSPELEKIKEDMYSVDFLILDDFGQEYMPQVSDYQLSELDLLLRDRLSSKKCSLITTNATEEEIQRRYHERLYSLLKLRAVHVIIHKQRDYRETDNSADFL